jgi:hypothetical protein
MSRTPVSLVAAMAASQLHAAQVVVLDDFSSGPASDSVHAADASAATVTGRTPTWQFDLAVADETTCLSQVRR